MKFLSSHIFIVHCFWQIAVFVAFNPVSNTNWDRYSNCHKRTRNCYAPQAHRCYCKVRLLQVISPNCLQHFFSLSKSIHVSYENI